LTGNVPYYKNQKVLVECVPCESNCKAKCATGWNWVPSEKKCMVGSCPKGKIKVYDSVNSVNVCQDPDNTFNIVEIEAYSLDFATGA